MKKTLICFFVVVSLTLGLVNNVFGFQPVSHHVLVKKIAEEMPEDSRIRAAILNNLEVATWGAIGPDIGYIQFRKMLGDYAEWADLYHYERTGELSKEMMVEAIKSNDEKQIAFAAGWLTHQICDLEGHKNLVNVEGGPALAHPEFDDFHKLVENCAEAYLWKDIGQNNIEKYNRSFIPNLFLTIEEIPFDLLEKATMEVHGKDLDKTFMKTCALTLMTGLETGIGYNYIEYDEAMSVLNENNRIDRLNLSVNNSVKWCATLLEEMENGDYSRLSNRWNLDVGRSDAPISTITVRIKTQDVWLAGTDHDIYFGLVDNKGKTYEQFLDLEMYNDFERGDDDNYYLYFDDFNIMPSDLEKIYIKKIDNNTPGGDWDLEQILLIFNGVTVFDEVVNLEINDDINRLEWNIQLDDSLINTNADKLPWE